MNETTEEIISQIKEDPKLFLMSQAINEISEMLIRHEQALNLIYQVLGQNKEQINSIIESLNKLNEAVNLIVNQMCITSNKTPYFHPFKGIMLK